MYWFKIDRSYIKEYQPERFSPFVWLFNNEDVVYGFPSLDHDTLKIAVENAEEFKRPDTSINPETVNRSVSSQEKETMFKQYIAPHFNGISSECTAAKVCLYTMTPQSRFVIDYLPGYEQQIIVASPCSGQGFKYSAAIGESLAQKALNFKCTIDVINLFGSFY